ncbi:MAG: MFS transporter [Anaerolineae bacterium]|nr:MFS transporter [Anaerolineae bacterium]
MTSQKTKLNPWLVLTVMCVPVFIGALDLTVVSAFLPELIIQLELPLQTALDDAAWILSGYLLAYTVSMTFMGRVSDLLGRRMVYILCLLIFLIGSVLVATAHAGPTDFVYMLYRRLGQRPDIAYVNLQVIIFGRVVQALGAGALVPVSLALVGDLFPPAQRARPLGLVAAMDTLGWVLGHLYGGLMVQIMPWQGIFWLNVPITLVTIVLVIWALRTVPQYRVKGRFDFLGAALIVGALVALNIGLGGNVDAAASAAGFEDLSPLPPYFGPMMVLTIVFLAGFVWVERRVHDPLVNLAMFRRRNLSAGALVNLFVGFCLVIGLVSVPILVNVRQEDVSQLEAAALQVGLLLSTLTVPMALAAVPGGWLSDRIGYRRTTLLGLGLAIIGFLAVWRTWYLDIPNAIIAVEMAVVGVGLGLTFAPIGVAVINAARQNERGVASALVIILRLIGMTVSVSALTTLSLNRVNALAAAALSGGTVDPMQAIDTYARITVEVLAELGLIGAIMCALACIPALLLGRDDPALLQADSSE